MGIQFIDHGSDDWNCKLWCVDFTMNQKPRYIKKTAKIPKISFYFSGFLFSFYTPKYTSNDVKFILMGKPYLKMLNRSTHSLTKNHIYFHI